MPRGLRQKHGSSSNPYSTRGLDKFSTVLADLQSRREQIMAKAGSKGVSAVRFAYSNSHDSWVPIVVKPREQRPELGKPQEGAAAEARRGPDVAAKERQAPPPPELTNAAGAAPTPPVQNRVVEKSFSWKAGSREGRGSFRWKPSCCWPTVVVLILLCLAFGRAFAICCTSIWWYSVPSMKADEDPNVRKPMKKDYRRGELARRSRELAANTKKDGDLAGLASPRHHQTSTAREGPVELGVPMNMKADEGPNVRKPTKKDYRRRKLPRRSRELAANTKDRTWLAWHHPGITRRVLQREGLVELGVMDSF